MEVAVSPLLPYRRHIYNWALTATVTVPPLYFSLTYSHSKAIKTRKRFSGGALIHVEKAVQLGSTQDQLPKECAQTPSTSKPGAEQLFQLPSGPYRAVTTCLASISETDKLAGFSFLLDASNLISNNIQITHLSSFHSYLHIVQPFCHIKIIKKKKAQLK